MKPTTKNRRRLIVESSISYPKLGDVAELRVGMSPQRADFYILTHDYIENVGKPVNEYSENRIGVRITSNAVDPEEVKRNLLGVYRSGYYNSFETALIRTDFYAKDDRRVRLDPVILEYIPVRIEIEVATSADRGIAGAPTSEKPK